MGKSISEAKRITNEGIKPEFCVAREPGVKNAEGIRNRKKLRGGGREEGWKRDRGDVIEVSRERGSH